MLDNLEIETTESKAKPKAKPVIEKNQELLARDTVDTKQVLNSQIETKEKNKNSVLNKYLRDKGEYEKHLAELRKNDFVQTYERKLPEVKIHGYHTHWASTDPNTKPSIRELQKRGYDVVPDQEMVETGHHSVAGSGFHILMAIPQDIADKRKKALAEKAFQERERVFKKKIEHSTSKDDFLYEKNRLDTGEKDF